MTVIVYRGNEATLYVRISGLGIGHLQQDLVLVPETGQVITILPHHWTRVEIHRVDDVQASEAGAKPVFPQGFRKIDLGDE